MRISESGGQAHYVVGQSLALGDPVVVGDEVEEEMEPNGRDGACREDEEPREA